jgi:calcium/calmodulin-dependent protein kinase I
VWLTGTTATDYNIIPEIRAYMAKARLRRGIEIIKLANRIEALKMQEDEEDDALGQADVPAHSGEAVGQALAHAGPNLQKGLATSQAPETGGRRLSRVARGAIFREVVLAKVREMKDEEKKKEIEKSATERARQDSEG